VEFELSNGRTIVIQGDTKERVVFCVTEKSGQVVATGVLKEVKSLLVAKKYLQHAYDPGYQYVEAMKELTTLCQLYDYAIVSLSATKAYLKSSTNKLLIMELDEEARVWRDVTDIEEEELPVSVFVIKDSAVSIQSIAGGRFQYKLYFPTGEVRDTGKLSGLSTIKEVLKYLEENYFKKWGNL
jgi:hypothetical protein